MLIEVFIILLMFPHFGAQKQLQSFCYLRFETD